MREKISITECILYQYLCMEYGQRARKNLFSFKTSKTEAQTIFDVMSIGAFRRYRRLNKRFTCACMWQKWEGMIAQRVSCRALFSLPFLNGLNRLLMLEKFPFAATGNEKQMDWVRWRFYGQSNDFSQRCCSLCCCRFFMLMIFVSTQLVRDKQSLSVCFCFWYGIACAIHVPELNKYFTNVAHTHTL